MTKIEEFFTLRTESEKLHSQWRSAWERIFVKPTEEGVEKIARLNQALFENLNRQIEILKETA